MIKSLQKILIIGTLFVLPVLILAQGEPEGLITCTGVNCEFEHLISTIQKIIKYLIVIASVFAAVSFMYAGFLYLFSMGNPGKISQAHEIFKKVVIGYIIMLSAWLAVYALEKALLDDEENGQLESSFLKPKD